jgi:hypothetical protein
VCPICQVDGGAGLSGSWDPLSGPQVGPSCQAVCGTRRLVELSGASGAFAGPTGQVGTWDLFTKIW